MGGLIDSAKLFTAAQTTATERRTLAEVTPYCTFLFPDSIELQGVCKVSVQRNLLADLRHKNDGFTQDGLDNMAFQEQKFMRLAKQYVFYTLLYIDELRVLKFVAVRALFDRFADFMRRYHLRRRRLTDFWGRRSSSTR